MSYFFFDCGAKCKNENERETFCEVLHEKDHHYAVCSLTLLGPLHTMTASHLFFSTCFLKRRNKYPQPLLPRHKRKRSLLICCHLSKLLRNLGSQRIFTRLIVDRTNEHKFTLKNTLLSTSAYDLLLTGCAAFIWANITWIVSYQGFIFYAY